MCARCQLWLSGQVVETGKLAGDRLNGIFRTHWVSRTAKGVWSCCLVIPQPFQQPCILPYIHVPFCIHQIHRWTAWRNKSISICAKKGRMAINSFKERKNRLLAGIWVSECLKHLALSLLICRCSLLYANQLQKIAFALIHSSFQRPIISLILFRWSFSVRGWIGADGVRGRGKEDKKYL